MSPILIAGIAIFAGIALGYASRILIVISQKRSLEIQVKQITVDAKDEAANIRLSAEKRAEELIAGAKQEERETKDDLKKTQERLVKKEELLDNRQKDIDRELDNVKIKVEEVKQLKEKVQEITTKRLSELERVASLSSDEAKQELISEIEKQYEEDLRIRMTKIEDENNDTLKKRAQEILSTIIHRLAQSTASEITTTSVSIPSDDIKGKIIGKEGRNIRAFEQAAGVELIVDDTPGMIVISSFDPIRRQIARLALENLVLDGRIQPAKIEEFIKQAQDEIHQIVKEKGEQAAYEVGVFNMDPRLVTILGRLYFRTSYGQNVLQHSIEMAHLAGMLAEELGADVSVAKEGALLHDIGKALDHEVQGTHVEIGIRMLQKFGARESVVIAMKSHHDDYPHGSIEAVIVQVCDMISGARPGARRDTVENYLRRLGELEAVAQSFGGVDKCFALQAGREIRVFVQPESVNDVEAKQLAREIAKKIEAELKYPGEIKVTLIRENRIVEFAR